MNKNKLDWNDTVSLIIVCVTIIIITLTIRDCTLKKKAIEYGRISNWKKKWEASLVDDNERYYQWYMDHLRRKYELKSRKN